MRETTIDAAGGRAPPASHEPSKEVARALRACKIVRPAQFRRPDRT